MSFKTSNALHKAVQEVMSTLSPRERTVLADRCGYIYTLEEAGRQFDVTRERIRQIEHKALRKCRHPSRSDRLRAFIPERTAAPLAIGFLRKIEPLIRISSDLLLLHLIFGVSSRHDDLKTELKARLVAVLEWLESEE